jgi:hypothetical protein
MPGSGSDHAGTQHRVGSGERDSPSDGDIRRRGNNPASTPRGPVVGGCGAAALLLAVLMTVSLVLGIAFDKETTEARINSIIHCKAKDIQEITLLPLETHAPLVNSPVRIKDRATINTLCQALNSASRIGPNHPAKKWEVIVELRTAKGAISFVVYHTEQADNGTLVSIMSHVTSGWNYGSFRSDSLAPILEELARTGNEATNTPGNKGDK